MRVANSVPIPSICNGLRFRPWFFQKKEQGKTNQIQSGAEQKGVAVRAGGIVQIAGNEWSEGGGGAGNPKDKTDNCPHRPPSEKIAGNSRKERRCSSV